MVILLGGFSAYGHIGGSHDPIKVLGLRYGIQGIADDGVVSEPYGGTFNVLADVVRTTG